MLYNENEWSEINNMYLENDLMYLENDLMYLEDALIREKEYEINSQSREFYDMYYEDERYHELEKEIIVGSKYTIKNRGTYEIYLCKQFNEYHVKVNANYIITSCSICGENYRCSGKYCRGGLVYDDYDDEFIICTYNKNLHFSLLLYSLMLSDIKSKYLNFTYKNYTVQSSIIKKNNTVLSSIIKKNNNKYYFVTKQLLKKIQNKLNNDIILYICDFI